MKSRDIFRLAIKLVGFIVLLQGLRNVVECLLLLISYDNAPYATPRYWAAWAFIKLFVGVYLMVGNTPFLKLAFPLAMEAPKDAPETTQNADNSNAARRNGRWMEPKAIFGIVVKSVGLIVFLYGLEYFVDALMNAMKAPEPAGASDRHWVLFSVIEMAVGLALMRGSGPLVSFAFPEKSMEDEPEAEKTVTQEQKPHD